MPKGAGRPEQIPEGRPSGAANRLIIASATSNLGDGMALVAFPWLASLLTRQPILIGLVGAAVQLAWIGGPLIAGILLDRHERIGLIRSSLVFQFCLAGLIAIAVLTFIDMRAVRGVTDSETHVAITVLILSILMLGIAEVIRDVGTQAVLPELTSSSSLDQANSRLLTAELVAARFAGQPLGGLLLMLGAAVPLFIDSLTFLISALVLRPLRSGAPPEGHASEPRTSRSIRAELGEGLHWLWQARPLRVTTLALSWNNLMSGIALSGLVLYAQDVLDLAPEQYGILLTAGAFGGVVGGFLAPRLVRKIGLQGVTLVAASSGAIAYAAVALGASAWAAGAALFLLGAGSLPWSVASRSLRQRTTPPEKLGRVTAAHRALNYGAVPLGTVLGGAIASLVAGSVPRDEALTLPFMVAAAGMVLLLPIAWTYLRKMPTSSDPAPRSS